MLLLSMKWIIWTWKFLPFVSLFMGLCIVLWGPLFALCGPLFVLRDLWYALQSLWMSCSVEPLKYFALRSLCWSLWLIVEVICFKTSTLPSYWGYFIAIIAIKEMFMIIYATWFIGVLQVIRRNDVSRWIENILLILLFST